VINWLHVLPYLCDIRNWEKVYLETPVYIGYIWLRKVKTEIERQTGLAILPLNALGGGNVKEVMEIISRIEGIYAKIEKFQLTEAHKRWLEYLKKKNASRQDKNKG